MFSLGWMIGELVEQSPGYAMVRRTREIEVEITAYPVGKLIDR